MPTPPRLNDPAERAAYKAELRAVARPLRMGAVWLAVAGALLAALRVKVLPMPVAVPAAVLALAFFLMVLGVTVRVKYHQRRMRGDL
jgi:membrane protein YdbS with pleckstrin-like domain